MSLIERKSTRPIKFTPNINPYSKGSVMAEFGNTKVHITASVEENVPPFLKDKKKGWITAEYSMLPSSTDQRIKRERGKVGGRTQEIQRLIGRCLRSVVNLEKLGERTIIIDCDVLVADGGTRTAAISGGFVALNLAIKKMMAQGLIKNNPIVDSIAAISIGINSDGKVIADLNYEEDASCQTDMNVVMTEGGDFVEIQGTAEETPFSYKQLEALLSCAKEALKSVFDEQRKVI